MTNKTARELALNTLRLLEINAEHAGCNTKIIKSWAEIIRQVLQTQSPEWMDIEKEFSAYKLKVETAIEGLFRDLRMRIDLDNCDGYKEEGEYVFPMGNSVLYNLDVLLPPAPKSEKDE